MKMKNLIQKLSLAGLVSGVWFGQAAWAVNDLVGGPATRVPVSVNNVVSEIEAVPAPVPHAIYLGCVAEPPLR